MRGWSLCFANTALLVCSVASAQTTGDISGRVTDSSETPLPGVTIEATSSSLPGSRVIVTDRDGQYRIPAIPPGAYRVLATLSGFRPVEQTCTVTLDSSMTVNLTLRLETEEHLRVSGKTPPIDTTSTTTGTNYTSDVISRLPVSRNYADIVRANPGVSSDRGDTEGRFLALSIYGATSAENQWIVDGVNTTNVYKGIQGKAINNEFVQEVEVKTGGYQAEYGRALGGVINVITKSGGNAYHGDTFLYFDSTDTRAEPLFQPKGNDLLGYIRELYDAVCSPDVKELAQVQKMKKYLNYVAAGTEPTGQFLHDIRRVTTRAEFFNVCERFLQHDEPMALEPLAPANASEVERVAS